MNNIHFDGISLSFKSLLYAEIRGETLVVVVKGTGAITTSSPYAVNYFKNSIQEPDIGFLFAWSSGAFAKFDKMAMIEKREFGTLIMWEGTPPFLAQDPDIFSAIQKKAKENEEIK